MTLSFAAALQDRCDRQIPSVSVDGDGAAAASGSTEASAAGASEQVNNRAPCGSLSFRYSKPQNPLLLEGSLSLCSQEKKPQQQLEHTGKQLHGEFVLNRLTFPLTLHFLSSSSNDHKGETRRLEPKSTVRSRSRPPKNIGLVAIVLSASPL